MSLGSPRILWQFLRRELLGLGELCFPTVCPLCASALRRPEPFCEACLEGIDRVASPCCPRCALPYPGTEGSDHLCQTCLQEPPAFRRVTSIGLYQRTLRRAVRHFKYEGQFHLDRPLAQLLEGALQQPLNDFRPDLLVAVPLHVARLRQRGYNQALLLARALGRRRRLPVPGRLLVRTRPTPPQIGLRSAQRRSNLRGAFAVRGLLNGERVLLIDDVLTTGATARECSRTLLAAGAGEVAVAVLARAPLHG